MPAGEQDVPREARDGAAGVRTAPGTAVAERGPVVSNLHDVIGAPTPGVSGVTPRPVPQASHFGHVLRDVLQHTRGDAPASLPPPTPERQPPAVQPAARPRPQALVPHARNDVRASIRRAAASVGVDPAVSLGVARAESNFDPQAHSSDGLSVGTFQVTNATAAEMRRKIAAHVVSRPTGTDDVALGVGYLRYLHDLFGRKAHLAHGLATVPVPDAGERRLFAVAAFNAGEGRVAQAQARARASGGDPTHFADVRRFLPSITRAYVGRVATYAAEPDRA